VGTDAGIAVVQGGAVGISSAALQVIDVDNTPAQLTYTITAAPGQGSLLLNGVTVASGGTFTQDDINAGRVSYVSGASASGTDSFTFSAHDPLGASAGPATFSITIDQPPPPPPPPVPVGTGTGTGTGSGSGSGSGGGSGTSSSGSSGTSSSGSGSASTGSSGSGAGGSTGATQGGGQPVATGTGTQDAGLASSGQAMTAGSVLSSSASSNSASMRGQVAEARGSVLTARFNPSVAINAGVAMSEPSALASGGPGAGGMSTLAPIGSALNINGLTAADQHALTTYRGTLGNSNWMQELNHMRDQVDNSIKVQSVVVGSGAAVTSTLSVGYVIWLLRGGLLVSSLLSSLPAWHAIDPLPVLGRADQDEEDGDDADPLERLFSKAKEAIGLKRTVAEPTRPADEAAAEAVAET
jgi:hypothetical protein